MDNRVSGSDFQTQADLEGFPRHVLLTDGVPTYQMKVSDRILIVKSSTGEDATGIVTLPSVADSAGKMYYICAPTGSTDDDVSIYIKETAAEYTGLGSDDGDLDADEDYIILLSTGKEWRTVTNGVAA
jgi:hypothetical protein